MARGRVQCGRCDLRFDAVEHLLDESTLTDMPKPAPAAIDAAAQATHQSATSTSAPPREQIAMRYEDVATPVGAIDLVRTMPDISATQERGAMPHPVADKKGEDVSLAFRDIEAELETLRLSNDDLRGSAIQRADDILLQDVPHVIVDRDEMAALRRELTGGVAPRHGASAIWGIGAALLLIALAGQLLWFEREPLLSRFPALRGIWQQACEGRICALPPQRDLSALHILARDVRDHPRYEDALLVNATLINDADFSQPFPVLELTLFDRTGQALGIRRFDPKEYLDSSIPVGTGMKPEQPVYIVIELVGIGDEAVSFEFKFL